MSYQPQLEKKFHLLYLNQEFLYISQILLVCHLELLILYRQHQSLSQQQINVHPDIFHQNYTMQQTTLNYHYNLN